MRLDSAWKISLSELCINISAAWFVAVFTVPIFSRPITPADVILLLSDITLGIFFLVASVNLKRYVWLISLPFTLKLLLLSA